jgi:predicted Zn-dependent peptidase
VEEDMFYKYTLSNGLKVVAEKIPYVKSITVGVWFHVGSRNEDESNNGISHFIEHMLFKGTSSRNAKGIAETIENIGGQLNAFTGKECTCYYAKVLDSHLPIALDVLSDMVFNSNFDDKEMEKEKGVIGEEISMYEDSPEDLVHDIFSQRVFAGHPLGMPILGTHNTVSAFTREQMLDYFNNNYNPDNSVIAVAGNFEEGQLHNLLEQYFGHWKGIKKENNETAKPNFTYGNILRTKDIEQVHLCIGTEGLAQGNEDMYSLLVINNILGGGMSSRLFQTIREDKGLAYSVFSYPSSYLGTGLFTIYAGMNPNQLGQVVELINKELTTLVRNGLSEEEIGKSKEQLKGNYILGLESTSSRMSTIGKSEILLGKTYSQKEILEKIDGINKYTVDSIIEKVFKNKRYSVAAVGNNERYNDINKVESFKF